MAVFTVDCTNIVLALSHFLSESHENDPTHHARKEIAIFSTFLQNGKICDGWSVCLLASYNTCELQNNPWTLPPPASSWFREGVGGWGRAAPRWWWLKHSHSCPSCKMPIAMICVCCSRRTLEWAQSLAGSLFLWTWSCHERRDIFVLRSIVPQNASLYFSLCVSTAKPYGTT